MLDEKIMNVSRELWMSRNLRGDIIPGRISDEVRCDPNIKISPRYLFVAPREGETLEQAVERINLKCACYIIEFKWKKTIPDE